MEPLRVQQAAGPLLMHLIVKHCGAAGLLVFSSLLTGLISLGWVSLVQAQDHTKSVATSTKLSVHESVEEGAALAKSKNCLGCHQIDAKRVGPGFVAVAKRYSSVDAPLDYLSGSLQRGGAGRWGAVPMPAQPHVSDADARQIAAWILSLPKQ